MGYLNNEGYNLTIVKNSQLTKALLAEPYLTVLIYL